MAWDNTVITNKGLEMLRQAIDGGELTIISASGSDEIYPAASLMVQTTPANEKQTFNITEIRDMDNGIRVRVTITNDGLTKGYVMKQLCLWARLSESEEPQIIAISQDEVGTAIPAEGEIASYLMQFYVLLKVDTATNMKIVVENSAFVTLDVVEELLKNKADLVNGKISTKQLTLDKEPTEGSNNPISSSGAKAALDRKQNTEDAFSGDFNDLDNVPPSFAPSEHTHNFDSIDNKPESYPPSEHTHPYIPTSEKGRAGGVAGLNKEGKVYEEQLPEMDFYPKEDILNSTTRSILGLTNNSVPTDALNKLNQNLNETIANQPYELIQDIIVSTDISSLRINFDGNKYKDYQRIILYIRLNAIEDDGISLIINGKKCIYSSKDYNGTREDVGSLAFFRRDVTTGIIELSVSGIGEIPYSTTAPYITSIVKLYGGHRFKYGNLKFQSNDVDPDSISNGFEGINYFQLISNNNIKVKAGSTIKIIGVK